MIAPSEQLPKEEVLAYGDVPFLKNLTPESKTALEKEHFTVATISIRSLGSEMVVPMLTWDEIERNVEDLLELFGEPILEVNINSPDHVNTDDLDQTSFISRAKFHLGDLTDTEFRERFFTNQDLFNLREVGKITSSELSQNINQRLMGRLHAFYHAKTNVGEAANLDLPAPGLQLTSREHMIWMVGNLRVDGLPLTSSERRVARVSAILHDWGKMVMSRNGQHPEIGAAMARSILLLLHKKHPKLYSMEFVNDVCWVINMHHLLERIFKPLKAESLEKIGDKSEKNRTLFTSDEVSPNLDTSDVDQQALKLDPSREGKFAQIVKNSEEWYLFQAAQTSLEKNQNEHVISVEQYHSFMEYLQILAYYEDIPESKHALRELTELLKNPNTKNIGLLLAMVRVIEADLVATDRPPSETFFRLNQLQLVLQGILVTAEA